MNEKPHADEAGFIDSRQSAAGQSVVLYDAAEAGFDPEEGIYVVFCTAHGDLDQGNNLRTAQARMRRPQSWCRGCCEAPSRAVPAPRPVPFSLKTPDEQAREIRLAARTLGSGPDKAELFEAIYGVSALSAVPNWRGAISTKR